MPGDVSEQEFVEIGCSWIDDHESELIELLGNLVAAPSEAGNEGTHDDTTSIVAELWGFLKNHRDGITLDAQEIPEEADYLDSPRENIYAVLPGDSDAGFVATSHTDIVSPGSPSAWPADEPYHMTEGIVRRSANSEVEIDVEGELHNRKIRDKMARVWNLRGDEEQDILIGRGVYDNKASIVSLVGSLLALQAATVESERSLAGDVVHGHLVDEEVYQVGIKNMVGWGTHSENWLGDRYDSLTDFQGVVLEGSYGWVPIVGHRGLAWVTLRADGESAHASTPQLAQNAVVGMGKALAQLDGAEFDRSLSEIFSEDELLGELTVAAGTTIVGGGVESVDRDSGHIERGNLNTIPDWCETTLDIRLPRWKGFPEDPDGIRDAICTATEEHAAKAASNISFTASLDDFNFFPPAAIAEDRNASREHPFVQAAGRATKETFGYEPGIDIAPGVTDGAFLYQGTHMPTIVEYGPAGALSHEPLEFVEREQVIEGAKVLLRLAIDRVGLA